MKLKCIFTSVLLCLVLSLTGCSLLDGEISDGFNAVMDGIISIASGDEYSEPKTETEKNSARSEPAAAESAAPAAEKKAEEAKTGSEGSKSEKKSTDSERAYGAWLDIDKDGNLYIETNVDTDKWNGYTFVVGFVYSGGGLGYNLSRENSSGKAKVRIYSMPENVIGFDVYLLNDYNAIDDFRSAMSSSGDFDKAIEAVSDELAASFELHDIEVVYSVSDADFDIVSFEIDENPSKKKESYTVKLDGKADTCGSYMLNYCESGTENGVRCSAAIFPSGDKLEFTREQGHFDRAMENYPGGYFVISHNYFTMNSDGSITQFTEFSEPFYEDD